MRMNEILLKILILAYGGISIFAAIGYWPTISDLYFRKKPSANISSYALWTGTTGVAFLYSLFILPDLPFRLVSFVNFAACATVLVLSLGLKNKH